MTARPAQPFPTGGATGQAKFKTRSKLSPKEAKLQGQAMLVPRIMQSKTHEEIARLFGLHPTTVARRLAEARSGELSTLARDIIVERMLPQALTVLEVELQKGNYEAAKDVLYGLQVLQKGGAATITHVTSNSPTLDAIRKERAVDAVVVTQAEEPQNDGS